MAYLNEQERDALLNQLKNMNFMRAKSKLRKMDPKGKIALFRNVQETGEWITRYDLNGLGTRVTLIEDRNAPDNDPSIRAKAKYELVRVIVEPTADNRT